MHGYFAADNSYLDKLNYDFSKIEGIDCRRDSDADTNAPLHISLDYNRRIHPIAVDQVLPKELQTLKGLHSLYPAKLKDAVDMFVQYYKPHKRKFVYYWYDHMATGDQQETRQCDDVIGILRKNGWIVKGMYIGQQPGHEERYRMWGDLLTESGKYKQKFTINRENCDKLILSVNQTKAEQRKNGFGKDKKSEHDENFPADESTHYTDALDTWVFGVLESKLPFGDAGKGGGGMVMS